MKKIMIMFLFLLSSIYSFVTINDNLNLLKDEEKSEINEKIEEIQNEKGLTIFVNTLAEDEGFAISDPERAMILNLKRERKKHIKLNFLLVKI